MTEALFQDGTPVTGGWFVVNVRDARWLHNRMRSVCRFGGEGDAHFDDLGVSLYWLQPGQSMSLYHHEAGQEGFLFLWETARCSSRAMSGRSKRGISCTARLVRPTRSWREVSQRSCSASEHEKRREVRAIQSSQLQSRMVLACRMNPRPRETCTPRSASPLPGQRPRSSLTTATAARRNDPMCGNP